MRIFQVSSFIAPSTNTVEAVTEWLALHNVSPSSISPSGDWVSFTISVEKANVMMDADFSTYVHVESDLRLVRTLAYSVPSNLSQDIRSIHPTTRCVILCLHLDQLVYHFNFLVLRRSSPMGLCSRRLAAIRLPFLNPALSRLRPRACKRHMASLLPPDLVQRVRSLSAASLISSQTWLT